jgi:glutamate dehydrogenase (NAD(P)+)
VAVQGFGAVGRHAARFLAGKGAKLVAAADSKGAVYDPGGLDIGRLAAHKAGGRSFADLPGAQRLTPEDLVGIDCDIWIPAARPDVLREDNVDRLKARLVLQGANIPITREAELALHKRGVLSIPDFIANAGGVICAAVEYHGGTETAALATIRDKILANTTETLARAKRDRVAPREAAEAIAKERVRQAMGYRRKS